MKRLEIATRWHRIESMKFILNVLISAAIWQLAALTSKFQI